MSRKRKYLLMLLTIISEKIIRRDNKVIHIGSEMSLAKEDLRIGLTFFSQNNNNFSLNLYEFQTMKTISVYRKEIFKFLDGNDNQILERIGV